MLNKAIYLAAFAAFAFGGVYADEQISEETTVLASDVQDSDDNDQLLGRCPCRDKKRNDTPTEDTTLVCGCDEEEADGIVHAYANLAEDEESTVAHHGEEGEHDLAADDAENDAEQIG